MAQGRIKFGIDFDVNTANLATIQNELRKIANLTQTDIKLKGIDISKQELESLQREAQELSNIFAKSYNFKLNTVDFKKLRENLNASNISLTQFTSKAKTLGGDAALSVQKLNAAIYKTQTQLKETSAWADKLGETFKNTIRWTAASAAINGISGAIQKAWSFTKQLDTSLNDIRIVTGKSADEMDRFAARANKAAKALGASTKSYADAALIYYQQGLSDTDVAARADTTVKAANVTGQNAQAVSEQLTAVWNGYKVSASEAELYIDKLANVAATTAADLEELSIGMSKVASAANIMGVDIDQLNAQLATIVSVTREAPESIGTALKTVYARMSDIQAGIDTETSLGEYTKQMAEMNVNVLDAQGHLRDMGDVVEEIGSKWHTLSREQQTSLAQTIAGTRQYSRMMALFDNWDMYQQAKSTSASSAGTLQKQQDIYLDSMEAKMQELSTAAEKMYLALVDNEGIKELIEDFTSLVDMVAEFVDLLGGGKTLLLGLGGLAVSKVGGKVLGDTIGNSLTNKVNKRANKEQINEINKGIQEDEELLNTLKNPNQIIQENEQKKREANAKEIASNEKVNEIQKEITQEYNRQLELTTKLAQAKEEGSLEDAAMLETEIKKSQKTQEQLEKQKAKQQAESEKFAKERRAASQKIQDVEIIVRDKSMTAEEQAEFEKQLNQRKHELKIRKQLSVEEAKLRDEREAENIRATETIAKAKEKVNAVNEKAAQDIKKIQEAELKSRQQYNENLRKELAKTEELLAEEAANKELEQADTTLNDIKQEQNAALEIFKRQARTQSGNKFSDKTQFTYKEGAESGGGYINPAHAAQALQETHGEFAIHQKGFEQLSTGFVNPKTDILSDEFSSKMESEFTWLIEHRDQLDLTGKEWEELIAAYRRYEEAMKTAKANPKDEVAKEEARIAGLAVTGAKSGKTKGAVGGIKRAIDQNEKAQNALDKESIKKYKKALDAQQDAKEKANKATLKADEKRAEQEQDLLDESTEAIEKATKDQTTLREKQAKVETNVIEEEITEQQTIIEENNKANVAQEQEVAFKNFGKSIAETTGGLVQMAGAITALNQLPDIWDDKDLSTGEKFLQTILVMLPAIASMASGFASVTKGIGTLISTFPTAISGLFGVSAAEVSTGAAGEVGAKGVKKLNDAMKANPYLLIIGAIIMAIVAAITALIAIFDAASKAYNADAIAAEKAAAKAEELAEAYKNTKAEYEKLKQSIEDYHDAQSAIDKMIIGTDEWREAIADANEQVMELIQAYPELAKYLSSEGGRLTISEEGLEQVEKAKAAEVNASYRESLNAQINASEAQLKANRTNYIRDTGWFDSEYVVKHDLMDTVVDLALTPGNEDILSSKDALEKALKTSGKWDLEIEAQGGLADSLWKHRESLEELINETKAANETNAALRQEIARSQLTDNSTYSNLAKELGDLQKEKPERDDYDSASAYVSDLTEYNKQKSQVENQMSNFEQYFGSETYQEQRKKELKASLYGNEDGDIEDLDNEKRVKLLKQYWSTRLGIPEKDIIIENEGGDTYRLKYTKDGEQQSIDYDYVDMTEDFIDQQFAASTISEDEIKKFTSSFNKQFGEAGTALNTAFSTFIGDAKGDFSALTKEQFQDIAHWEGVEFDDLTSEQRAELEAKAQALGLGTGEAAIKKLLAGIQEGIENYKDQEAHIQDLFLNRGGDTGDVLGEEAAAAFNKLSQASQTQIAQFYNDLALASADGAKVAQNLLSKITEDNIDAYQSIMAITDWSDWGEIADASFVLQDSLGLTAEEVNDVAFQIRYANGLIEEFNIDKAAEEFVSLKEVIDAVNEGESISADQYNALSDEMQSYFYRMADGTYELIGLAEDFSAAAKAARQEELLRTAEENIKKTLADFEKASTVTDAEADNKRQELQDVKDNYNELLANVKDIESREDVDKYKNSFLGIDWGGNDAIESINIKNAIAAIEAAGTATDAEIQTWSQIDARGSENLSAEQADALFVALEKARTELNNYSVDAELQTWIAEETKARREAAGITEASMAELDEAGLNSIKQLLKESSSLDSLDAMLADIKGLEGYDLLGQKTKEAIQQEYDNAKTILKKWADNFKIEVDPFEAINRELTQINNKMEKLQKLSSLITGEELVENLKQQNNLLEDSIIKTREKIALAQQETSSTRGDLENLLSQAGIDSSKVIYDEDGNITNWKSLMDEAGENLANAGDRDKAETIKADLAEVYDIYSDYILNEIPNLNQEISDSLMQILENNAEAFELELQIKIDENEAQKSFIEFKKAFANESAFDTQAELTMSDFENGLAMVETYQQKLQEANSKVAISEKQWKKINNQVGKIVSNREWYYNNGYVDGEYYGDYLRWEEIIDNDPNNDTNASGRLVLTQTDYWSEADKENQIRELTNALVENSTDLLETRNELEENYLSYQEAVNAAYDKSIELIEAANSALDHQKTMLELMYGDKATSKLESYYSSQVNNLKKISEQRHAQYAQDKADFEAMYNADGSIKADYTEAQIESITSQYFTSADAYFQSINDLATMRQEEYLNSTEALLTTFDETIINMMGSVKAKEEWNWMQAKASDYLDAFDAAFGIEQIMASYNKAANSTTDIKIQQKINKLKEQEIKILREKDKLSQYDLDRAQKQLDVLQARIALEDAQESKSQMRLIRGANGAYSYQYVADQNAIDEAREKLNKAQQDLVNLDEEQLKSNVEKVYDIYEEMMDKIRDIIQNGGDEGDIQAAFDQYLPRIQSLGEGVSDIMDNIYASVEGAKVLLGVDESVNQIFPWLDSTWMDTVMENTEQGWTSAFNQIIEDLKEEANDYSADIKTIYGENGTNFNQLLSDFNANNNKAQNLQQETINTLNQLSSSMELSRAAIETLTTILQDKVVPATENAIKDNLGVDTSDKTSWTMKLGDQEWQISLTAMATGGYTGEWGPEGKLAVLHEKELVLNKQDTANILSAVDLVRSLGDSMMNTMAFMSSGYAMSAAAWELAKELIIEQTVNINAEFPNATDRAEIEAAFEELVGLATQHAYKNKRD